MTHEELLERLWEKRNSLCDNLDVHFALSAVVELHKRLQYSRYCAYCVPKENYPCQTIQAIEKELTNGAE